MADSTTVKVGFIDAVKTGESSAIRSDYADALETLRVTLAASESFRTGDVICLSRR